MAFEVVVKQRPEGMDLHLAKAEMSADTLQLKLIKDLPNVMSVNGAALSMAQKRTLRAIGTAWQVTDLQATSEGEALVTIRREGHVRKVKVALNGQGRWVDGQGDRVQIAMADPLAKSGWGLDRLEYNGS